MSIALLAQDQQEKKGGKKALPFNRAIKNAEHVFPPQDLFMAFFSEFLPLVVKTCTRSLKWARHVFCMCEQLFASLQGWFRWTIFPYNFQSLTEGFCPGLCTGFGYGGQQFHRWIPSSTKNNDLQILLAGNIFAKVCNPGEWHRTGTADSGSVCPSFCFSHTASKSEAASWLLHIGASRAHRVTEYVNITGTLFLLVLRSKCQHIPWRLCSDYDYVLVLADLTVIVPVSASLLKAKSMILWLHVD